MTDSCPQCGRRLGLVPAEIAKVGSLLQCGGSLGCKAVLMVTKSNPGDFEVRLATEAEKGGTP